MNFKFKITQDIIDMSYRKSRRYCMVAVALRLKECWSISVSREAITYNRRGFRHFFSTPANVAKQLELFDTKGRGAVRPFEVYLQNGIKAPIIMRGPTRKKYKPRTAPTKRPDAKWCPERRNTRAEKVMVGEQESPDGK
jgi:hypothetical protein